ncbi:hypothetical protein LOTGIDRAFT_166652 [Lottia gigantea]|uniref:Uncharacterized protein n=1 Tax=Lottia gigantea TaxID=225164 RepID=V3Z7W9_LOTGI|nr:hypothetical protein LOTGIDRAFT_166652 [Lottia gigantea]ESO86923.1 hypothetical protein LOTGIDRAFT_166652 [Lottia gigantea]
MEISECTGNQIHGSNLQQNIPDMWKTLINKHLGTRVGNKYRNIARDIQLVDSGIKAAFLFDYSCVTSDVISDFLNDLNASKLLSYIEDLNVIEIALDVLICNRKQLSKIPWDRIKFVDISRSNSGSILPADAPELKATKEAFEWILSHTSDRQLSVEFTDNLVNPTTLFGVMIGYPVVYWYDVSKENGAMLSMVPLKCIQIFQQRHLVYSFSLPMDLWLELEHVIQSWFSDQKTVCCDLTLDSDVKTLSSVAL